jgi:hypothetical protein
MTLLTRRGLLAGTFMLGLGGVAAGQTRMRGLGRKAITETYDDQVRLEQMQKRWPDGRDVPPLLVDLARHVKGRPWMSLGAFRLTGDRLDDHWIEHGVDCWPQFGTFMRLPDGSRVAQWFRDGAAPDDVPIVYIGSEGDVRVEAASLEAFLAAWALAAFRQGDLVANGQPVSLPSELIRGDDDDVDDGRPALATFLRERLRRDPKLLIKGRESDVPLKEFFQTWGERERARIASDPTLRAIAKLLDAYVPRGKEPSQRESLRVRVAGARCEIDAPDDDGRKKPVAEEQALIPLVLAAREARAQGIHAVRGLWHSAIIRLLPNGQCHIAANWGTRPVFRDGAPPRPEDSAADLARFPRSARWLEPWMTQAP